MRKVLLLALVSMFFATACNKTEETAPAPPEAAASAAAPAEAASHPPRRQRPRRGTGETGAPGAPGADREHLARLEHLPLRLVRSIAWCLIRCGGRSMRSP